MSKEQRQSLKLLESESFNVCKNAEAPMIVMLDCSEMNTKVSDADIKIIGSDNCKEVLRDDRDINGVLATIREGARLFYKDE